MSVVARRTIGRSCAPTVAVDIRPAATAIHNTNPDFAGIYFPFMERPSIWRMRVHGHFKRVGPVNSPRFSGEIAFLRRKKQNPHGKWLFPWRKSKMQCGKSLFPWRKSEMLCGKWLFPWRKSKMLCGKSLLLRRKIKILCGKLLFSCRNKQSPHGKIAFPRHKLLGFRDLTRVRDLRIE